MAEKGDVFPPSNLGKGDPWAYHVQDRIAGLEHDISRVSGDTAGAGRASKAQLSNLASQIRDIRAVQSDIQSQQEYLESLQGVQYNERTSTFTISSAGWYNGSRPSVSISSPTGRLEIGYGGSCNNGAGYFAYSIVRSDTSSTVVSRDSVVQNGARRVAVTGGVNFAPSGWRTAVISVPVNVPLTVQVEIYANGPIIDPGLSVFGAAIQAKVAA